VQARRALVVGVVVAVLSWTIQRVTSITQHRPHSCTMITGHRSTLSTNRYVPGIG